MRRGNAPKSRWPPWIGVATLVGLILLQQLNGILSNLAVELLPKGWAQQRSILIIVTLLIAIFLVALLTLAFESLKRLDDSVRYFADGERRVPAFRHLT